MTYITTLIHLIMNTAIFPGDLVRTQSLPTSWVLVMDLTGKSVSSVTGVKLSGRFNSICLYLKTIGRMLVVPVCAIWRSTDSFFVLHFPVSQDKKIMHHSSTRVTVFVAISGNMLVAYYGNTWWFHSAESWLTNMHCFLLPPPVIMWPTGCIDSDIKLT